MNFCPHKPEGDRPDRPAKGRPCRKRPRTGVLPDSHICARSRGIALPQPPALAKAGVTPAPEPATACTHRSVRPSAPLSPLSRVAAPAAYRGTAASSGKPFLRQAQHRLLRYAPLPAGAGNGATQDKGMAGRRRAPRPTQQGRRAPDTSRHEMYESGSPRCRGPSMDPDAAAAGGEQAEPTRLPREPRLDPGSGGRGDEGEWNAAWPDRWARRRQTEKSCVNPRDRGPPISRGQAGATPASARAGAKGARALPGVGDRRKRCGIPGWKSRRGGRCYPRAIPSRRKPAAATGETP